MLNWKTVALATLGTTMATSAFAVDTNAPGRWTGFHAGIGGGGNLVSAKNEADYYYSNNSNPGEEFNSESGLISDSGKAGGFGTIDAGYDYQFNAQGVVGVIANFDFGSTSITETAGGRAYQDGSDYGAGVRSTVKLKNSWALGARLGYLPSDSTLLYVTGGYTQADLSMSLESQSFNEYRTFNTPTLSHSEWKSGYFLGAGVETLLSDTISLKGEYRYSDYGSVDQGSTGYFAAYEFIDAHQKADVTVHSIRAVLSYRF